MMCFFPSGVKPAESARFLRKPAENHPISTMNVDSLNIMFQRNFMNYTHRKVWAILGYYISVWYLVCN